MGREELLTMIRYYREQGAPQDQQMVIAFLREAQEAEGGVLTHDTLNASAQAFGVSSAMLRALIRRVPSLRCEDAAHRLEVCATCKAGLALRNYIEKTYDVKSGACSQKLGFSYHVVPCMKNCKNGPSVKWDGKLYSGANEKLIRDLIGK